MLHELAPDLVIWECDTTVYPAGWLKSGIVGPGQLGTTGYLFETPAKRVISGYWELVWNDKLVEAMDYAKSQGWTNRARHAWVVHPLSRQRGLLHALGGAFKYAASVLGLPIGSYPESRPPQAKLPIRRAKTSTRRIGDTA